MSSRGKKILTIIIGLIVLIGLLLLIGAWKAGVFEDPVITVELRGPYHFVYIQKTGDYSNIPKAYKEADDLFKEQSLEKSIACGMYLDNPAVVEGENLRWRVGYFVKDSISVEDPLKFLKIPNAEYAVASINAHPMVAPLKTYPALQQWVQTSDYQFIGPAYEIYNEDGIIEVLFPIGKK